MTSLYNDNRCKLLVLDIDTNRINSNDLRTFFTFYGPIEWIEIIPRSSSAIIYFTSYLIVDRLVSYRACLINEHHLRLRRFRFDKTNWKNDSRTLSVKLTNTKLTGSLLLHCFKEYQSCIVKVNVYSNNQASIYFSDFDCIDKLLLLPVNTFQINNESLILGRMIQRNGLQWKQPLLDIRDPVINQLLDQIGCLSKQLREEPSRSRHEIERLEAELFILKNENAQLKSKQSKQNIEKRLTTLEDISNRLLDEEPHRKRLRSNSNEKQIKRHQ